LSILQIFFQALVRQMPRTEICLQLCKCHIEGSFSTVRISYLSHFIGRQLEVEYFKVFLHVLRICVYREYDSSFLNVSA
jgi:hypothetical protein